jgi:hypothetical protein
VAIEKRRGRISSPSYLKIKNVVVISDKICARCRNSKPIFEFHLNSSSRDGHQHWCRECSSVHHSLQRNSNLDTERLKEAHWRREWRRKNPEKAQEYDRQRRLENKDKFLEREHRRNLKRRFGMTVEQYEELLAFQNGVCGICGSQPNGKKLAVDHCHETNKIRGLLCGRCNPAVGYVKNNPAIAQALTDYLIRNA